MGIDALARVATGSVLCISSSGPDPTHGGQGLREGLVSHPDSLSLAREALVGRHYPAPLWPTVTSPFTQTCCHRHKGRYLTPRTYLLWVWMLSL